MMKMHETAINENSWQEFLLDLTKLIFCSVDVKEIFVSYWNSVPFENTR